MTKMGSFYIFIHSIFSAVLAIQYLVRNHHRSEWAMVVFPMTLTVWFLVSSFFAFWSVNKEHDFNEELNYKFHRINARNHSKYQRLSLDANDGDIDLDPMDEEQHDEQSMNQQFWTQKIYRLIQLDVLWFIAFSALLSVHNSLSIGHSMLSINEWSSGYVRSCTMVFHRAFIVSTIYNVVFHPSRRNTVCIAIGAVAFSLILNLGYFMILILRHDHSSNIWFSWILVTTKLITLCLFLFCLYKIYRFIPTANTMDIEAESLRRRPTMLDMIGWAGPLTLKQRCSLKLIVASNSILLLSMQSEVVFMLFLLNGDWSAFNHLLLWSLHLAVIYLYVVVVSVQWTASFVRASSFVLKLNVSFIVLSVWTCSLVAPSVWKRTENALVIVFCVVRALCSLCSCIGFARLKTIHPFTTEEVVVVDSIDGDRGKRASVQYMTMYLVLLTLYFAGCLLQSEWNGDLFALNLMVNGSTMSCNWAIIGGETPGFGLMFHSGLLSMIFILDSGVTKRWAPSWDLSRAFLICTAVLGLCQIIHVAPQWQYVVVVPLVLLLVVSLRLFCVLHSLDNVFPNKPSLFI